MKTDVPVAIPTRVLYNYQGDATTPERAYEAHNAFPDVIFVRNDGWSLGAPKQYERIAYDMWKAEWIGFAYKGQDCYCDIEDYYPSR